MLLSRSGLNFAALSCAFLLWQGLILCPFFPDSFDQFGCRLVIRVLGHQLAAKGLGKYGLGELVNMRLGRVVAFLDLVCDFKEGFDAADDFLLLDQRWQHKLIS